MRSIKLVFFTFYFIICVKSFAFQPANTIEELQLKGISNSKLIFQGQITRFDSIRDIVTFKIFRIFKGASVKNEISIKIDEDAHLPCQMIDIKTNKNSIKPSSYGYLARDKGIWLVYADNLNDSILKFNQCTLSRSITNPESLFIWPYIKINKDYTALKILALTDWLNELIKLNEYKRSSEKTLPLKNNFSSFNYQSILNIFIINTPVKI